MVQGDVLAAPFRPGSFDVIWCVNMLHHLHDPFAGLQALATLLTPGGQMAVAQSGFLPDMYFAWDARLERLTTEAVRRYYRDRYGLAEEDLSALRGLVGLMRQAGLAHVSARTFMIERISPLRPVDEAYLLQAVFQGTWSMPGGERLRPYLPASDYATLSSLCDPQHPGFALRRPDFHFLQTLTLVTAHAADGTTRAPVS